MLAGVLENNKVDANQTIKKIPEVKPHTPSSLTLSSIDEDTCRNL
jgi:hypothetical protein